MKGARMKPLRTVLIEYLEKRQETYLMKYSTYLGRRARNVCTL